MWSQHEKWQIALVLAAVAMSAAVRPARSQSADFLAAHNTERFGFLINFTRI
jgi:hypothetical protein